MVNKLGPLICWLLYLGLVRLVAREALPFIVALVGLALVFGLLVVRLRPRA